MAACTLRVLQRWIRFMVALLVVATPGAMPRRLQSKTHDLLLQPPPPPATAVPSSDILKPLNALRSGSSSADERADQLFALFGRSANVTAKGSPALRQLRNQRSQSFAQALLDSNAPGARTYILDVKREALSYRVDVARRNCAFASRVAKQWLAEAYKALGAANRTATRNCLQTRVWSNSSESFAPFEVAHGAPARGYFSSMVPLHDHGRTGPTPEAAKGASSERNKSADAFATTMPANFGGQDQFQLAEKALVEASDLATDLWSALHNDPPQPLVDKHGSRNRSNTTREFVEFRDKVEAKLDAAARVYEHILADMDYCSQVRPSPFKNEHNTLASTPTPFQGHCTHAMFAN